MNQPGKTYTLLIIFLAILCARTSAQNRSDEQLIHIAAQVLQHPSESRRADADNSAPQLHILRRMTNLSIVGQTGTGFVIVSHNENIPPVLGYCRTTTDTDEWLLPCGLEWYLQTLNSSLKAMADDGYEWTPVGIRPDDSVKPQVEPMLETDWYQRTPFNDWCPTFVNDKGQIQHHVVGCGATATTQVMYYHRHPSVGQGATTYSYDPKQVLHVTEPVAENMLELSCNFDTVHFDWSSMAAHYGNKRSSDEAANVAVARLCKTVGIAMHMKYTETSGSGSGLSDVLRALRSHFGYSLDARSVARSRFADSIWTHMAFEEISNGRPIVYGGNPGQDQMGHFFVLDGYDADGLFHINWGWGRNSYYDGYFDLNYLRPNNNNTHYSVGQGMVVMVHPEGTPIDMTEMNVAVPGSLSTLLPTNRSLRLRIKGTLNASDIRALRQLGCGVKDAAGRITAELTHLDLSQASLVDNVLPDSAFLGCTQLMQLELPSSVVAIGSYALASCYYLTHLTLPRSLTTLGTAPFTSCVRLTDFSVEEGNRHFATIDGILTNANRNKLVAYPEARSEAVIPSTIDSIGPHAFRYCLNLSEVHIPSHVRVICENAFQNCTNLQQVTLEEGVQRILALAFNNCDSLRSLHLPASIDSLGQRLFIYSDNMQIVTLAEGNPNFRVENNCLLSKDGKQLLQAMLTEVETVDIPTSVEMTEKFAFYGTKMTHLTIPSTLKKIGNQSIYFCQNLTQLDIKEGLETIDHYAFNGCSALTEVHLPASVQTIGYAVFINCTGLHHVDISEASTLFRTDDNILFSKDGTQMLQQLLDDREEYTIPTTVTTIGPVCFRYLNRLRRLTIPASITSIGNYQLYQCSNISDVTCLSSIPIGLSNYVFSNADLSQTTLHVPAGTATLYRRIHSWRQFANIVEQEGTPQPLPFMVMASWHQKEPFNGDCPKVDGMSCVAGCAPIAMAQILSYYRQPAQGHGHASYHYDFNDVSKDIDTDFDSHPFDWDNIRDVYNENSSDTEYKAVANLVYMTGVAMKQMYSPTATSTVNYGTWMWGLQHYLHLTPTSRWLNRRYYSTAEWTDMINAQLDAGHPVFYNAAHTEPFGGRSGHFFIIDGHDQQSNYHFNFGHDNSLQDKFGSLDACNQGTDPKPGNVFACYHYNQGMMTDCYPVDGMEVATQQRCEAALETPFVLENDQQSRGCSVTGRVRAAFKYRCICFNADSIWYTLGFYQDGQLVAVSPSWRMNRFSIGGGVSNVDRYFMLPEGLADGNYEMALVTRDAETSPWSRGWDNAPNRIDVSVNGKMFTFQLPDYHNGSTNLYLKDDVREIPSTREGGRTFEFTICNPSANNFVDTLRMELATNNEIFCYHMPTSVYDGQALTYQFFIAHDKVASGTDYSIKLYYHDTPTGQWLPLQDEPSEIDSQTVVPDAQSYVVYTIGGVSVRRLNHVQDDGELLSGLPHGIYIIRSANGKTRKVFVH